MHLLEDLKCYLKNISGDRKGFVIRQTYITFPSENPILHHYYQLHLVEFSVMFDDFGLAETSMKPS
jgi:hypothetical protein